jgi:RimJ/RimL family protein N-acetyltransferase
MLNENWIIRTPRLVLRPVCYDDLADLCAIKADPRVFAVMLGGVRTTAQTMADLADDIRFWGAHGVGMWSVREAGRFEAITGMMQRLDGRGMSMRFAFWPDSRGRGLAREAAGAALRFAHEQAGFARIVAVAREDNVASRTLLGAIGMRECEEFQREGMTMVVHESIKGTRLPSLLRDPP